MKSLRILLSPLALMLGCALLPLLAIPALAHAMLRRSDPPADAELDVPPTLVSAWFTQALTTGSRLSVFDSQFQAVDLGQTYIDASDATLMQIKLAPVAPGRYTVNWKAESVDGHESLGSFQFIVAPPPGTPWYVIAGVAVVVLVVGVVVGDLLLERFRRWRRLRSG
ncbi:MAG TPA: copper resistance CopC family protein [Aggregatilineales bacterium]|nr:copper resistance CopC family protein [Aggregatilineales bacterium]